jgi:predicted dehydrogenase
MSKTMSKIRVGLVGVGNWGRYGHIPALKLLPEYEIVAVASRSLETASALAAQFEIPRAFDDYRNLVEEADVDLVVVLPPAPQHAEIVKAAIANGKDVYCEWPLTTNTKDSEELLRLAEQAGVKHLVGLQRTVGASSLFLRDLLSRRYAGDLRSVRMHVSMSGFGPVRSASLDWTLPATNFSNVLSIYGGHFMDMLFHAVGQPAALSAIVKTQFPNLSVGPGPNVPNENPDVVMVMGALQNGALFQVHIEGGKLNQKGLQIEITGTGGDLEVTNDRSFVTKEHDLVRGARGERGTWQKISVPDQFRTIPQSGLDVSVQDLAQLYAAFAHDRDTGSKSVRDFADALAIHRLIDAIVDASSSNRTVFLKEGA